MTGLEREPFPTVAVLIVAGGKGTRMGQKQNKLFLPLGDSCILGQTLAVWEKIPQVSQIVVVCAEGEEPIVADICRKGQMTKVTQIVPGGKERQDSVWQGLTYLESQTPPPAMVAIHDGARPFYDGEDFIGFLQTVIDEKAAGGILAVPVQDTMKTVVENRVTGTVPRESLAAVQTPQLFYFPLLYRCYEKVQQAGILCTDDASILEWCGREILVYPGQKENIKITTPEDYDYARFIWAKRTKEASICE